MDWNKILGDEWYELLEDFIKSDEMKYIAHCITRERAIYTVYPEKRDFNKMFRIFRNLQPSNIKVIILGQDPYHDGSASGYSFCNNGKLPSQISPSLKNIFAEIEANDTSKEDLVLDHMDLERWVKQGVFLANTYLTVRKGSPGTHHFWKPFAEYWIKKLSYKYDDIIWLLWGRKAQEYISLINNYHHTISTSHPSPLGAYKAGVNSPAFMGSKCFEQVNNALWVREKELIKW